MISISERINLVCKHKNFSQRELAGKLGVTASAIYNIMSGKTKKPSADILMGFEQLGINSAWLISGEGIMEKKIMQVDVSTEYLIKELEQKDSIIRTLQGIIDSQLMNLGKLFDVLCSRFVFFVFIKDKFRYIKVM
jgi:transcriptional regulator with XRE-family HTH domain